MTEVIITQSDAGHLPYLVSGKTPRVFESVGVQQTPRSPFSRGYVSMRISPETKDMPYLTM